MRGHLSRRLIAVAAAVACAAGMTYAALPGAAETTPRAPVPKFYKVGYFTQWGIYERNFQVKKLDASGGAAGLTHLNYAFGNVTEAGVCASADTWADWQAPFPAELNVDGKADVAGQPLSGNFNQILELKRKHPDLRAMISLGGWTLSKHFSTAAATDASRKKLVSSCIDLFIKGNLPGLKAGVAAGVFDGIDLDWEWPGSPGAPGNVVRPADKQNFTALVAEFRKQLDAHGRKAREYFELSAFLPANVKFMDAGYEAKKLFEHFDFATVQGYDFHGAWEKRTNHQSALFVPKKTPVKPDFSVNVAITGWIDRGAPRRKLVVGVPFYSQGWTDVTGGGNGLYKPATLPAKGKLAPGVEDYKTVKQLTGKGFKLHRGTAAGFAWLFDGKTFWTYDDPTVMKRKVRYIRNQNLGGAMIWSLDGDDAKATLTKTISTGLDAPYLN